MQRGNGIRRAPQEETFESRPRRKATTQSCVAGRGQLWWRLRGARVTGAPGRVVVTRAGGHTIAPTSSPRHHQGPKEKRPLKACSRVSPWLAQAQRAHGCGSSRLSRPGPWCTAGGHHARPAPGTERVAGQQGQLSGGVKSSRAQQLPLSQQPCPQPCPADPSWLPAASGRSWQPGGPGGPHGRRTSSTFPCFGDLRHLWGTGSVSLWVPPPRVGHFFPVHLHWRHPLM